MFEMEEVHLVLETSRERHDILEEGVGQVGHHLDQEQSRELTTIFNKFTQELHEVNRSIDYVYTKWSSFPSNPGKEKCGKYLKTGSCAFGAKCKFDHPFQEPVKPSVEKDVLLFLTFITERLMKILKTFSYEAAVDVLSSLCSIVTLLESYYDLALTHPSYGQICYLYGDVIIRLSVDIDKFCSNKLSQKRTTPRFKRKGIELPDSNLNVFELCAERLETLNQKWLDWEENIRKETVHQLEESDASVSHITDQLSHSITQYAQDTLAHLESWALIREEIRRNLLTIFRQTWPEIDLIPFGSHENYLGTRNSDLDLTLQYQGDTAAVDILDIVGRIAEEAGYMLREVVKETRVPVCKLYDESYCIEIDIVVNNNLAVYNTALLRNYVLVDLRVRPLVLTVKRWAQCRGCNNPRNATLSSYAWTLMVLYFLMIYPTESPLPSIEEVGKIVQQKELTFESLKKNHQSLHQASFGKLLIQFFAFYGTCSPHGFQPFHSIVSLRNTFRVYKKSSSLHTGARAKSVGDVLEDHLGILKAANAARTELIGEVDTSRIETNDISNMVVYSLSPSWRFCIEDPYEEHDLGKVIFSLTGQIHIMDELKRCLTLFNDLVVKHRFHVRDFCGDSIVPSTFDFWLLLSHVNQSVPLAMKTCSICGQEGHFSKECDFLRCHLCGERGHFMKDCLRLFCSNCRKQGHFAKDCTKERICRYCKQPGHEVKDCPTKSCSRCGSKNHTTHRCKYKSTELHASSAVGKSEQMTEEPPQSISSEQKITSAVFSNPDVPKSLPRSGRVPPLPFEAKKNSLAKLSRVGASIKIVPPDSPVMLSPNEALDSPLPPSESKVSNDTQYLPVAEEMCSPELRRSEIKESRKKKKRKPRMSQTDSIGDRSEVVPSSDSTGLDQHTGNLLLANTSSTSSSPKEMKENRNISGLTSERTHAIRNPTSHVACPEDKKEMKSSLDFETNHSIASPGDCKFQALETLPADHKMSAPKLNSMKRRKAQNKVVQHADSHESKYIAPSRPPGLLLTHRSRIDASCSELSDFAMDSPTQHETKMLIEEMKKSKHESREVHARGVQKPILAASNSPEEFIPCKRVIVKRESKIIESKIDG